jgi:hypothetical protein
MKIAIYTIVKNEEKNIKTYLENIKDADGVFILDTGSTDNTIEILKNSNVIVNQKIYNDFKFDEALNDAMSYVPDDFDILINLDLDERLKLNWRSIITSIVDQKIDFMLYHPYVNDWYNSFRTVPKTLYNCSKIHSRKGVKWGYSVFSQIIPENQNITELLSKEILIYHYQEDKEDRKSFYKELILKSMKENSKIAEYNFFYAKLSFEEKNYIEAIKNWAIYLNKTEMFTKKHNSTAQMRSLALLNMAKSSNLLLKDYDFELQLLLMASGESPYYREVWCYLAQAWVNVDNGIQAIACIKTAKKITDKHFSLINEEWCWNENELNKILQEAAKIEEKQKVKIE